MATIYAKVFKHHKKHDGTYNVKICISHASQKVYLDTKIFVTDKHLTKDLKIKDQFILTCVNPVLDGYRRIISELPISVESFTAQTLKEYLLKKDEKVDFLAFCEIHLKYLENSGRQKSKANYNTVKNLITDFNGGRTTLSVELITPSFLKDFEAYLRSPRKMTRTDRCGKQYDQEGKPLGDSSVHSYLRDFSGYFSAAIAHFNKPSLGLVPIKYNPFEEYKIVNAPVTAKRNLGVEQLELIKYANVLQDSRAELARDLFMLSFYMCGLNAIDIFKGEYQIVKDRLEYKRSKTKGKRKDDAFISIHIPKEARMLLLKYGNLKDRYKTIGNLNHAISFGMRKLCEITGLKGITYYWARHTFANLARNVCGISMDDLAIALNHVDKGNKTTYIYVARDWGIVDKVQEAVINLLQRYPSENVKLTENVKFILDQVNLPQLRKVS